MEIDECPNRDQCQEQHRYGRKLMFERDTTTETPQSTATQTKQNTKDLNCKNVTLENERWTEILLDREIHGEPNSEEVKKIIVQMLKREERNPPNDSTDEFIRINRQTYSPVELQKDSNGRAIYTPIEANAFQPSASQPRQGARAVQTLRILSQNPSKTN